MIAEYQVDTQVKIGLQRNALERKSGQYLLWKGWQNLVLYMIWAYMEKTCEIQYLERAYLMEGSLN